MIGFTKWARQRGLRLAIGAVMSAVALVAGCGGGGGGSSDEATGTLRLALTDAPACGYDSVNVTVEKVRVHRSSDASDEEDGWSEVVLNPSKRVDLLTLTNGVLSELGETPLPAGTYTQLRLVLAENSNADPLANSVVPTGGSEVALKTPSGQQSGTKINVNIDVQADQRADFVLDFDACKSIVRAGNSGQYLLKPVLRAIPRLVSGIEGHVNAALTDGAVLVSLQQEGVVIRSTVPDATGRFLLQPVPAGTYDLVVTSPGRSTAVVTGVVVNDNTVTTLNAAASALLPPDSDSGTLDGAVSTGATPIDAAVRVLQTLSGGALVEVARAAVDPASGGYAFSVPVGAPVIAAYVAAPASLTFSADAPVAGKYSLEAQAGGSVKTDGPMTLDTGDTVTTDFVFP